jgi:hypothetical protein
MTNERCNVSEQSGRAVDWSVVVTVVNIKRLQDAKHGTSLIIQSLGKTSEHSTGHMKK